MKFNFILICGFLALLLPSCGSGNASPLSNGEEIKMDYAGNIRMWETKNGNTLVTLTDPWDSTKVLANYLLIEKGNEADSQLPNGTIPVTVPLERSVVFSGVHAALISELGARYAINGICDADFISDWAIKDDVSRKQIADCGMSHNPRVEKIVSLRPQAILLSPFKQSDETARFARTDIKVIQTADYMESTPLARAEWMRFYGRLYGKGQSADSLFNAVADKYNQIKALARKDKRKPKVLFDNIYNGIWSVPTSGSATGRLIVDAGGVNPFERFTQGGGAQLTPEEVLNDAKNADIWLIRHTESDYDYESLKSRNPIYALFDAYTNENIYHANTSEVPLFDDGAFHPNLVLKEMVMILHPGIINEADTLRYYQKLKHR